MRLQTKFLALFVASGLALVVAAGAVIVSTDALDRAQRNVEVGDKLLADLAVLNQLAFEYDLAHAARSQQQWDAAWARAKDLAVDLARGTDATVGLQEELETRLDSMKTAFARLQALHAGDGRESRIFKIVSNKLISQGNAVTARTNEIITEARTREEDAVSVLLVTIGMMIGLTLAIFAMVGIVLNRQIFPALHRIQRVAYEIGGGNFDTPVDVRRHDEFGDIDRALEIMRRKLADMRVDLIAETERAAQASQAKSHFLANMSHEIRTPMSGILGMADLLMRSPLTPEQAKQAEAIQAAAEGLLVIINDILDQSRIEAGKLQIDNVDFDLSQKVQALISQFNGPAQDKGLAFEVIMDADVAPHVHGDPTRVRQVLFNLIGNAIKFTRAGRVDVRISSESDNIVCFRVDDTGIGVNPESRDRLFQIFEQAERSTAREYGGSGLGLSIAKRLVELMNGEIGYEDRSGGGSTFWVRLPLPPAQEPVSEVASATVAVTDFDGPLSILVAEDNAINQQIIKAVLSDAGHTCDLVGDGEKAVRAASRETYDIVLMDIRMPAMDGIAAFQAIRNLDGDRAAVPIVALTADITTERVAEYEAVGFNGIAGKPIDRTALFRIMSDALAGRGRGAAA